LSGFNRTGEVTVDTSDGEVTLSREDLTVRIEGKDGYGAGADGGLTVILGLEITEELKLEGMAREIVNRLQNARKKAGLDVTDRIRVCYSENEAAGRVFAAQSDLIQNETLAVSIAAGAADWEHSVSFTIDEADFQLWLKKVD
jgi:isoleucyl-tRNA synthetase